MKKYIKSYSAYALSSTAKDTYILFVGNTLSAFFGFVFTVIIARKLSVSDFGIFSTSLNLILMLVAISDLGISAGLVRFVSNLHLEKNVSRSNMFIKAGLIIRLVVLTTILLVLSSSNYLSSLVGAENIGVSHWIMIIAFFVAIWTYFPHILIARKQFTKTTVVENTMVTVRLFLALIIVMAGFLNLTMTYWTFVVGILVACIVGIKFVGTGFVRSKPNVSVYVSLVKFSGWIGLHKVLSTTSNRLDLQILASMMTSTATGLYSIPSRLAVFIVILASSYSLVLSTRMAVIKRKQEAVKYLKKATVGTVPIIAIVISWIIFAKPIILLLFGAKFISTISTFRILSVAMIPFILAVPAVTMIIYTIKKPIYIGLFSIVQLIATFFLNVKYINIYGINGPGITFLIVNSIYALYTWTLVINFIKRSDSVLLD